MKKYLTGILRIRQRRIMSLGNTGVLWCYTTKAFGDVTISVKPQFHTKLPGTWMENWNSVKKFRAGVKIVTWSELQKIPSLVSVYTIPLVSTRILKFVIIFMWVGTFWWSLEEFVLWKMWFFGKMGLYSKNIVWDRSYIT